MSSYEIKVDLVEQQQNYLKYLVGILVVIGLPALALGVSGGPLNIPISLGIVIIGTAYITHRLRQKYIKTASWVYLLGLVAIFGIIFYSTGPNTVTILLMLVPTIVAFLLLDRQEVVILCLLSNVIIFVMIVAQSSIVVAISTVFAPFVFSLLLVGLNYVNSTNVLDLVYWATDVQQKEAHRLNELYHQKEQLSETLLQLTHAKARLELLNKQLAEAQHKTEQASMAKSVFLSNMSHELRTPLNVIIGYTSTMLDMPAMYDNMPLPDTYRNDITFVKDNGFYLLGLINDILDLSKIEAGKLELHCTVVELTDIFKGVLATATGLVKDKPLQLRPDYPQDLPKIWADPMRVRQILLNLMSNAIKFTQTGSVTIQAYVDEAQQCIRIAVIDTGMGISQKALQHIFDRFEQAEHDTDKQFGGTGLGLDISRQLARMHGFDLGVESTVGQGSTFFFALPLLSNQQAALEPALAASLQAVSPVNAAESDQLQLKSVIMLVEDDAATREMMRRTLESDKYVVVDVQDSEDAMKTAIGLLPDLIILDIYLPLVDGWQVLERLKSNSETSAIPIIVCTASNDQERAIESGAALYLQKPCTAAVLLSSVQRLLPTSVHAG